MELLLGSFNLIGFLMGWSVKVVTGLDQAIITMEKGEIALFTLPPELSYGAAGANGVPPNCVIQFEVELISWIKVVDVCKDGGIIKKVMEKGEQTGPPGDLDEVLGIFDSIKSLLITTFVVLGCLGCIFELLLFFLIK